MKDSLVAALRHSREQARATYDRRPANEKKAVALELARRNAEEELSGGGATPGSNNLDSSQPDVAVGEFVGLVAEDSTLQKQSIFLCPSIPTRRSGLQERRRWLLLAVSVRQSVDRVQGIARARGGSPCQRAGTQLQVTDQPWALYTKQSSMMDGIRDLPTGAQATGQDCVIWNGLCCS